jgi:hypothetical protein
LPARRTGAFAELRELGAGQAGMLQIHGTVKHGNANFRIAFRDSPQRIQSRKLRERSPPFRNPWF